MDASLSDSLQTPILAVSYGVVFTMIHWRRDDRFKRVIVNAWSLNSLWQTIIVQYRTPRYSFFPTGGI